MGGEIISFTWIGLGIVAALIADGKNRSGGCLWFALLLALGPISLVLMLLIPRARPAPGPDSAPAPESSSSEEP